MRVFMERFREKIIIVADDDEGHAELITEGLQSSGVYNKIIRFRNGEELWRFFSGETVRDETRSSDKGYIVILDINMPKLDGVEALIKIRENPSIPPVPVFILTTAEDPAEIERCYKAGCSVYITKPVDFSLFAETLHRLGLFIQIMQV